LEFWSNTSKPSTTVINNDEDAALSPSRTFGLATEIRMQVCLLMAGRDCHKTRGLTVDVIA
jgi:hypothetical protein